MGYFDLSDAYAKFVEAYGDPECCGKVHWSARQLELWLRNQPEWDGDWDTLVPELIIKGAAQAWDGACPA